ASPATNSAPAATAPAAAISPPTMVPPVIPASAEEWPMASPTRAASLMMSSLSHRGGGQPGDKQRPGGHGAGGGNQPADYGAARHPGQRGGMADGVADACGFTHDEFPLWLMAGSHRLAVACQHLL
ncbi:hypothetical protein ABMA30_00205, partial [Erwinia amylovora]|uniref:hypothetical protein n=1 Tax=Erwinia amylovora TaxID=552 RepID=UPI0037DDAFBB